MAVFFLFGIIGISVLDFILESSYVFVFTQLFTFCTSFALSNVIFNNIIPESREEKIRQMSIVFGFIVLLSLGVTFMIKVINY